MTPTSPLPGRLRPRGIAVIGVALVAIGAATVVWLHRPLPDSVAYAIDGQRVSANALENEQATLSALYGIEEPQGRKKSEAYWRDAAQASAVATLLDRAAEDAGVVVPDKDVDASLAQYLTALYEGAPDARDQFVRALGNAGTSQRAVEQEIRRRLTTERLIEKIVADVEAPKAADLPAEFTERGCTLTLPETRTLSNIVVSAENDATAIADQLAGGADFATLARQRSADGSSRDSGGVIGTLASSQLEDGYASAAFGSAVGSVFGPIETESGWNVGRVDAVVPGRTAAFAEVSESFSQLVLLERQSKVWRAWLSDVIEDADVSYSDRYRPEDPDALPGGVADRPEGVCPGGAQEER